MGGLGKTQAVLEYCKPRARLYSATLWIDASTELSVTRGFDAIYKILKSPDEQPTGIDSIQYVNEALRDWTEPWLLVFDNYDDPTAFRLSGYLPEGNFGHIIVTSRSPDTYRLGRMMEVSTMNKEDSLTLLYEHLNLSVSDQAGKHGEAIVARLGYLPLAIDQTGAWIRKHGSRLGLGQFLEYYENYADTILKSTPQIWEYIEIANDSKEQARSVFTT